MKIKKKNFFIKKFIILNYKFWIFLEFSKIMIKVIYMNYEYSKFYIKNYLYNNFMLYCKKIKNSILFYMTENLLYNFLLYIFIFKTLLL